MCIANLEIRGAVKRFLYAYVPTSSSGLFPSSKIMLFIQSPEAVVVVVGGGGGGWGGGNDKWPAFIPDYETGIT
jgi:hypothetical protein